MDIDKARFKRAVVIVFDSLGIGALPDAVLYGDEGSDTLDNLARAAGGVSLPILSSMGLGLIEGVETVEAVSKPSGSYGRMKERSAGKDTATGHWEIAGIITERPLPTFPEGLPLKMLERFSDVTGYGWLGGMPASGTEIIERLGQEHLSTGKLIVYTSADSVFQIAAHEELVPVEELYRVCALARELLYEYNVGRVIARPFVGSPGSFKRTGRRRDWSMAPPAPMLLDHITGGGLCVAGIGKIGDIFCHKGLTEEIHTAGDSDGIDKTIEAIGRVKGGLIFTNLVDFDTSYGHRNDAVGYARALERIDARLPEVMAALGPSDILFITADHGCDPTTPSTDHSREYVPLLVWGRSIKKGVSLGTRETFADLGQTIAGFLGVRGLQSGKSFLSSILERTG